MAFKEPTPAQLNESAMNHFSRGNGVEAAKQLQWALIGDPYYAEAWHNRALVLQALNDPFDAILCCDRAIDIVNEDASGLAAYYNTKGVCWAKMSQLRQAVACYDLALRHNPDLATAWHNKGSAARICGNYSDAVAHYEMAVSLQPDNPDYHLSYSSALLGYGRLAEGWLEYEYRNKVSDAFARNIALPEWRGESGATIVLYGEQGYGDTLMAARWAKVINNRHCAVILEVKKPLVELMRKMSNDCLEDVIAYGDPIPSNATHCLPIMSAARYCGVDTPADIDVRPYIDIPKYPIRDRVQLALSSAQGLRVGLCWNSGVRPHQPELREITERKSIAPHFLQPLATVPNISWFSLQLPNNDLPFPMIDLTEELHDFYETAKLMKCLDLVVTVDTSVAHLAGALGVPTIVMLPKDACWRWEHAWYTNMETVRQQSPGNWPSAIEAVVANLKERVGAVS